MWLNRLCICALIALTGSAANADSVDNANAMCEAGDAMGVLTEPCSVSAWNKSIELRVDYGAAQARYLCSGLADLASGHGYVFVEGWQIRVYSPFSGDTTIARCDL